MSAWEEWFLDVMENLSLSLKQLSLPGSWCNSPGSCCVLPSLHGRLLVQGGQTSGAAARGPGPSSGKGQVKVMKKGSWMHDCTLAL